MRDYTEQIQPEGAPLSIGEELFRAFQRGELSRVDYNIQNAIQVSLYADDWYPVAPYPAMNAIIRSYLQGRLQGSRDYDYPSAKKLGDWFFVVKTNLEENSHNLELLVWCENLLADAKLESEKKAIQRHIEKFMELPFPGGDFENVLIVKKKDAYERERLKKSGKN